MVVRFHRRRNIRRADRLSRRNHVAQLQRHDLQRDGTFAAYDLTTGRINPTQVPKSIGYSWNFDGFKSYTHTDIDTEFDPTFWAAVGKTIPLSTTSRTFSSNDAAAGTENDAAAYRQLGATTIYGGGTFDDPLAAFDNSRSRSDIVTSYAGSYLLDQGVMGHFSDIAPTSSGWTWSDAGTGEGFYRRLQRIV